MTNDELSELERDIGAGRDIGNSRARLLLEQLRANAAEAVRVNKRLADAERRIAELGGALKGGE